MNNVEVVQDFRRRYEGTFVWLRLEEKNKECLVKVVEVETSASKIGVLHLDSQEYGAITLNLGSKGHSIYFKYPPVGVFQHKGDALMFRRSPNRQYQRGVCSGNSFMCNVTNRLTGNAVYLNIDEVASAFKHIVFNKDVALDLLASKKFRSVALENNYALSLSLDADADNYFMFHWNNPIARISKEGQVSKVLEECYSKFLNEEWNCES